MGTDFILAQAPAHTKAWSAEYQQAASDLFAQHCSSYGRSFLATLFPNRSASMGECIHVRDVDGKVLVYRELSALAQIDQPTVDLMESLNASCGILDAVIDDVNPFLDNISINIGKASNE